MEVHSALDGQSVSCSILAIGHDTEAIALSRVHSYLSDEWCLPSKSHFLSLTLYLQDGNK